MVFNMRRLPLVRITVAKNANKCQFRKKKTADMLSILATLVDKTYLTSQVRK